MNQMLWRCTLRVGKPTLLAIAAVQTILIPVAQAGWIRDAQDAWKRSQQPPAPTDNTIHMQPITRDGFGYINQLGGGQNSEGDYNQPVRTRDAFGSNLPDGVYSAPAQWDSNVHIRYEVRDGSIWNQDYQFNRRGRH